MNARSSPVVLLAVLVTMAGVAVAATIEIALEEVEISQTMHLPIPYSHIDTGFELPEGDWVLPELVSEHPLFGVVTIRGVEHLLVFDKAEADDPFYSVLYFDAEGDSDLSDVEPIRTLTDRNFVASEFAHVHFERTSRPAFNLYLQAFRMNADQPFEHPDNHRSLNAHAQLRLVLRGQAEVGDETLTVQVSDAGGPETPSFLNIGTGPDSHSQGWTAMPQWLITSNRVFRPELDRDTDRLLLHEETDDLAALQIPAGLEQMVLIWEDDGAVLIREPAATTQVPTGSYSLQRYTIERADAQGDQWRLIAYAGEGSEPVVLELGSEVEFPMGEPYTPRITHRQSPVDSNEVMLDLNVTGAGGERVVGLSRIAGDRTEIDMDRHGQRPRAPRYRIVSTDGEIVAQGNFEYG